jgi:hypothetical protein
VKFGIGRAREDHDGPEGSALDRALSRELRALGGVESAVDVSARVLERVEQSGAARFSRRPRRVSAGPVAVAAGLMLAGLSVYAVRPWEPGRTHTGTHAGTMAASAKSARQESDVGLSRVAAVDRLVPASVPASVPGSVSGSVSGSAAELSAPVPRAVGVRTASRLELGSTRAYEGSSAWTGAGMASGSEVTEVGAMARRTPTREELVAWAQAQRQRTAWMSWFLPTPSRPDEKTPGENQPAVAQDKNKK